MSSKPFSIRFPDPISKVISSLSRVKKMSSSEVIREAIESSWLIQDNFHTRLVNMINNKDATLSSITESLFQNTGSSALKRFFPEEIAFQMHFWNSAYQTNTGVISPRYFNTLLEITRELLTESEKQKIDVNLDFCLSRLQDSALSQNYNQCIDMLKASVIKEPSLHSMTAEVRTRPLLIIAEKINEFSPESLDRIFTATRFKELYPLLVKGVNGKKESRTLGFSDDGESYMAGLVRFIFSQHYFYMAIKSGSHAYVFKPESLCALFSYIQDKDEFGIEYALPFNRETLFINAASNGSVEVHENGQYRLTLSQGEFTALKNILMDLIKKDSWLKAFNLFKNTNGHL